MDKQSWLSTLFFSLLILVMPFTVNAQSNLNERDQVFELLEGAFQAQVSLSEQERTMAEVEAVLEPYFTNEYKKLFIKENVVGQEGKYQTYGTDFAPYYIPYYGFSDKTKVVAKGKEIYVVEYFPGNTEGPVGYESHYEGLKLIKDQGKWKVAQYLYNDIPKEVINKAYPEKAEGQKSSAAQQGKAFIPQTIVFGPSFGLMQSFAGFDVTFGNENKTILFGFM
ncbi:DUF3993 domain-containing protein [Bacillus sp. REN3]|uniref:DUF3993 domain-containing protein n=1 Tax=Bacillus sp. REN3 TaxID=2802440 RepID=UPI001AEEEDF4|nr:DUF3993 domain-containing protein [Bacillus sp. REN3]